MANKNVEQVQTNDEQTPNEVKVVEQAKKTTEPVVTKNAKSQKSKKDNKAGSKKKEKKANVFQKTGKKLKETNSELKKVAWPKFSKVAKQTGVVIAIVLIFALVLLGIDQLLGYLFGLMI